MLVLRRNSRNNNTPVALRPAHMIPTTLLVIKILFSTATAQLFITSYVAIDMFYFDSGFSSLNSEEVLAFEKACTYFFTGDSECEDCVSTTLLKQYTLREDFDELPALRALIKVDSDSEISWADSIHSNPEYFNYVFQWFDSDTTSGVFSNVLFDQAFDLLRLHEDVWIELNTMDGLLDSGCIFAYEEVCINFFGNTLSSSTLTTTMYYQSSSGSTLNTVLRVEVFFIEDPLLKSLALEDQVNNNPAAFIAELQHRDLLAFGNVTAVEAIPFNKAIVPIKDASYGDSFYFNTRILADTSGFPLDALSTIPSDSPSDLPSAEPSDFPSTAPSDSPSESPSNLPSTIPSDSPSDVPSTGPSEFPSTALSYSPSVVPSYFPSTFPSMIPSDSPSGVPSVVPSVLPSPILSDSPSVAPSAVPNNLPSTVPSDNPSIVPSGSPSDSPSAVLSNLPSSVSSNAPSDTPLDEPSTLPSITPAPSVSFAPVTTQPVSLAPTFLDSCIIELNTECVIAGNSSSTGQSCDIPTLGIEPCLERPTGATMLYNGGDCAQSDNTQELKFTCQDMNGGPPIKEGEESYIVATDIKGQDITYFKGVVSVGGLFPLNDNGERFQADMFITIYALDQTTVLQEVQFQSSCSQNLELKDRFGAAQLVEFVNERQSVVTYFQTFSFSIEIAVPIEANVMQPIVLNNLMVMTNLTGDLDLTDQISGQIIMPDSDPVIVTLEETVDASTQMRYTLFFNISGNVTETGQLCTGTDTISFLAGNRPGAPGTIAPSTSSSPSVGNSAQPTDFPSAVPSSLPSNVLSNFPSVSPSNLPSLVPSVMPSAGYSPSDSPSDGPSISPSAAPSFRPTSITTAEPSSSPSTLPSENPNSRPSSALSPRPSSGHSAQPSAEPSVAPNPSPSAAPSFRLTSGLIVDPSSSPSTLPSENPNSRPSSAPSAGSTAQPSAEPTVVPSVSPRAAPSSSRPIRGPIADLSSSPSTLPSKIPNSRPSSAPSAGPTSGPTAQPSAEPSVVPSASPRASPSSRPTSGPIADPSSSPSTLPSPNPNSRPSLAPSAGPTSGPTAQPSAEPSVVPSASPRASPSSRPTSGPIADPSSSPSTLPSPNPNSRPSLAPSAGPTSGPTAQPSAEPSVVPSASPRAAPSSKPTSGPIADLSSSPSTLPSGNPNSKPSSAPSSGPSAEPNVVLSVSPRAAPSSRPTSSPIADPDSSPSTLPSGNPNSRPSSAPSSQPTDQPNAEPSVVPSASPRAAPSSKPTSGPIADSSSSLSTLPSANPNSRPSSAPFAEPTSRPAAQPSAEPNYVPSASPRAALSSRPPSGPIANPSSSPSIVPFPALAEEGLVVQRRVQISIIVMRQSLTEASDIDTYEAANTRFYQTFLPNMFVGIDATVNTKAHFLNDQGRLLQNTFTVVGATLEDQFLYGQELMTLVEVTANTDIVDESDLQSTLYDIVNDNPDAFISFLGPDVIWSEVIQVTASEPNSAKLVGDVLIDLSVMEQLLSSDATRNFESAITSFYEQFLLRTFTDISASVQGHFLDAKTLTTLVQVNVTSTFPTIELSPLLSYVVNDNEDAFIDQIVAFDPESFANVTQVSSGEPVMTPVSGVVRIELFPMVQQLIGNILEIFESVTSAFYQDFLPDIFLDIEASLMDQFLEGQELTAVVQVNGTTFTFDTDLQSYLQDVLNENEDAFINQLSEIDPVAFGNLTSVRAVNLNLPTSSPAFFVASNEDTGGPNDTIVVVVSIICAMIAVSFLCFHFKYWARIFGQQQPPVNNDDEAVEADAVFLSPTENDLSNPLREDARVLH